MLLFELLQGEECDSLRVAHVHQPAVGEQAATVYDGGIRCVGVHYQRPDVPFRRRKQRNARIAQHQQTRAVHRLHGIAVVAGQSSLRFRKTLQRSRPFVEQV